MRRIPLAGLNCRNILPKTVESLLRDLDLQYNWTRKVKGVVLGICLARGVVLQDIARKQGGQVKKTEKALSEFLGHERLDLHKSSRQCTVRTLRCLGRKCFFWYQGKLVLLADSTSYVKLRSRGKQKRMPEIGQIRLHNVKAKETILVPGYNEFWTGLLLKDKTCLGITRKLFTETMLTGFSQNTVEEIEIKSAIALVKEAFGVEVIIVADQGFRRKDLLEWLKESLKVDFIIRINGHLKVKTSGWDGLLEKLGPHWRERLQRHWRDDSKNPLRSSIGASAVKIPLSKNKSLQCNVLCLTPMNREDMEPMFVATTLPIELREHLSKIVTLYSCRWAIETFFFSFKQSLRAEGFRVFSCWEAIDRLLAMAHMAFLVLHLLFVWGQGSREKIWKNFWGRLENLLLEWFARPPEFSLGYFFQTIAQDYGECRWAWSAK